MEVTDRHFELARRLYKDTYGKTATGKVIRTAMWHCEETGADLFDITIEGAEEWVDLDWFRHPVETSGRWEFGCESVKPKLADLSFAELYQMII